MAFGDDILSSMNATPLPSDAPITNALAQNALKPAPPTHGNFLGGLGNVLGTIGDAMLIAHGIQPIHYQRQQEARQRAALSNYLGQIDPGMGAMLDNGLDANTALALYKLRNPDQPDFVRELKAAGIDPASDEGKRTLLDHIKGVTDDGNIREYQFAKGQGYGGSYMDFLQSKQGPLIANNGDGTFTIVPRAMVGGQSAAQSPNALPRVGSPDEARRLPPGSKFLLPDGRIGTVPGGATASNPSPTFR